MRHPFDGCIMPMHILRATAKTSQVAVIGPPLSEESLPNWAGNCDLADVRAAARAAGEAPGEPQRVGRQSADRTCAGPSPQHGCRRSERHRLSSAALTGSGRRERYLAVDEKKARKARSRRPVELLIYRRFDGRRRPACHAAAVGEESNRSSQKSPERRIRNHIVLPGHPPRQDKPVRARKAP